MRGFCRVSLPARGGLRRPSYGLFTIIWGEARLPRRFTPGNDDLWVWRLNLSHLGAGRVI